MADEQFVNVVSRPLLVEMKDDTGTVKMAAEIHMFGVVVTYLSPVGEKLVPDIVELWKAMVEHAFAESGRPADIGEVYRDGELAVTLGAVTVYTTTRMLQLLARPQSSSSSE